MSKNRWLSTGNYNLSYEEENKIFKTRFDTLFFWLFIFAVTLFIPVFRPTNSMMFVIINMMVVMLVVMGLNITTGFTGLINIGQAALMGVGAYSIALVVQIAGSKSLFLTHFWPLAILLGGLIGALFGAIVGLPSLRLKHLYLAITTLAFQIIFEWFIKRTEMMNQGQTISLPRVNVFEWKIGIKEHYTFWYYVTLMILIIMGFALRNIMRSRYGRAMIAVRDNDRAADAMGIHPGLTKVTAFALAGFFAGLGGVLKAYLDRGVGIESYTIHFSIEYLAMAIVGGLGSFSGAFWGTGAVIWLDYWAHKLSETVNEFLQLSTLSTAIRPLVFGLLIILFLMFEPRGINNWWIIIKNYTKRWPFKY